jgi:hypothetical protein
MMRPIALSHSSVTTLMTVEQAIDADRQWFTKHPEADEYQRLPVDLNQDGFRRAE